MRYRAIVAALTVSSFCIVSSLCAVAAAQQPQAPGTGEPKPARVHEAKAQVIVLHATNEHEGIDPRIGDLPQLKKPPFSAYDTYKLLDRHEVPLVGSKPGKVKLPDTRVLEIELKDVLEPKKPEEKPRYLIRASIAKPGQKKKFLRRLDVNAKPGEIFFVAGQAYKKGILVLGIRVLPK